MRSLTSICEVIEITSTFRYSSDTSFQLSRIADALERIARVLENEARVSGNCQGHDCYKVKASELNDEIIEHFL